MGATQCNRQASEGAHMHPQSAPVTHWRTQPSAPRPAASRQQPQAALITIPAPFSDSSGPHLGVLAAHGQAPVVAQTAVVPATVSNARAHQRNKLWAHGRACTFDGGCCPWPQAASQVTPQQGALHDHHRPARLSPDLLQALQVIAQLGVQRGGGHLRATSGQKETSR